jgi:hypothetical protein
MKIKLRFVKNKTIWSKLVRIFTWSEFSHVDYVFDDGKCFGALPQIGVNFNTLRVDYCEFYEMEVKDKAKIEFWLLSQRGKAYDWMAILAMPFRRNWQDPSDWFCSELIATALEQDTPMINEPNKYRVTPRDLLLSPFLKKVD